MEALSGSGLSTRDGATHMKVSGLCHPSSDIDVSFSNVLQNSDGREPYIMRERVAAEAQIVYITISYAL